MVGFEVFDSPTKSFPFGLPVSRDIMEPSNIVVKSTASPRAHPRFRGITSGIPPRFITSSITEW